MYWKTAAGIRQAFAMIRDQHIWANTLQHLLLDTLSMTVAVCTHAGILAHGSIPRIWAELSADLNPDDRNVRRMKGPTPASELQAGGLPDAQ